MRLIGLAVVLTFSLASSPAVSWLVVTSVYGQTSGRPFGFVFTGPEEVVIPNGNPWGLIHTPDESVSYRREGAEIRMWLTASVATVLLRGPSFETLVPYPLQNGRAVPVLSPSGSGFDSHYAGAGSVLPAANGRDLLMFYHAEGHPCNGPFPFLGGIGLARSSDGGFTWQRRGQVISTAAPMPTNCNFQAWGVGNPSVYRSRDGLFLYMLFLEWLRGNPVSRPDVLYLARAPIASDGEPGSWQKYSNGQFSEPGLGGLGTPVINQPPPDGPTTVYAGLPSVSFNVALNRYAVVFQSRLGFHGATSADGVQWDTPRLIWQQPDFFLGNIQNVPSVAYPALISPDQPAQETTSQSGYLYFARGFPQNTPPHIMSRRRFVIGADLVLALGTSGASFSTGDAAVIRVDLDNPGRPSTVDFYFGAVLPDEDTTVFFRDLAFNTGVGSLRNPASLQPIVGGVDLTVPFTFSSPAFFTHTWAGTEPPGTYTMFLAAVRPGAFVDGRVDPGDIVFLSTQTFTFTP